jgi:hypothetical protein
MSRLPEDFVCFGHRQPRDMAQAPREDSICPRELFPGTKEIGSPDDDGAVCGSFPVELHLRFDRASLEGCESKSLSSSEPLHS